MIKRIERNGELFSLVVFKDYNPNKKYDFLTKDEAYLQIGINSYVANDLIPRHRHKNLNREIERTEEILMIRRGRLLAKIYDDEPEFIDECEISEGDLIYLIKGGHSFIILEDTQILEVKQGPYLSKLADKEEY